MVFAVFASFETALVSNLSIAGHVQLDGIHRRGYVESAVFSVLGLGRIIGIFAAPFCWNLGGIYATGSVCAAGIALCLVIDLALSQNHNNADAMDLEIVKEIQL